jgi:hypothetical protein
MSRSSTPPLLLPVSNRNKEFPMAHPAAVVFALSMAVWVADVRLAPASAPASPATPAAACENGLSASAPAGADAEVVICAPRVAK